MERNMEWISYEEVIGVAKEFGILREWVGIAED